MDPALFAENERTAPTQDARAYANIGPYTTEGGTTLSDVTVAYEQWGSRTNPSILVCHALTGDSHATGWWSRLVGPGHAIDTDHYHVLCSNVLGGCQGTTGPGSRGIGVSPMRPEGVPPSAPGTGISQEAQTLNPELADRSTFPLITVGDMVEVQARLLDHLNIERLHLVAGGSMGGMQALEWPLRHPDRVERVFTTASAPRHSAMQIAFNEVGRQAILRDSRWKNGDYAEGEGPTDGLAIARMIGHLTFLSAEAFDAKFARNLQRPEDPTSEFAVESYLRHQGDKFTSRFDARSLVLLTRAIDAYDRRSFLGSKARYLTVGYTSDWIYPMSQSEEIARLAVEAGCEATHLPIALPYGHDSFLLDGELQAEALRTFLK